MFRKYLQMYRGILMCTLVSLGIGIIAGTIDAVFGRALLWITDFRTVHVLPLLPCLPLGGLLILWMYKRFSQESLKGMSLVFEAGFGFRDRIPAALIPLVMVSTWITHLFGGSAGREGVAVQLGATVANAFSRRIPLPNGSRIFLIAGMAAGFAGLFQTPLAATFFAMEVLVAGSLQYEALLPAITAAYAASYTSHWLGLEKFAVKLSEVMILEPITILKLIAAGIAFGIVGGLFAHFLDISKNRFSRLIKDPFKKIAFMGCVLAVLLLVFHMGRYGGLGTNLILASFSGETIYAYDWLLKLALTVLTLSAGYQGGEVTPLFAIGACLGVVLSKLLGLPLMLTAALGYAAVFGSATNTLLAPILIGAEVFGSSDIVYFAAVCSLAYVFNGNRTIYSKQKQFNYLDWQTRKEEDPSAAKHAADHPNHGRYS